MAKKTHAELDNYSNQLNPTANAYWQSRGYKNRPEDWEKILDDESLKHLNGKVVKK